MSVNVFIRELEQAKSPANERESAQQVVKVHPTDDNKCIVVSVHSWALGAGVFDDVTLYIDKSVMDQIVAKYQEKE